MVNSSGSRSDSAFKGPPHIDGRRRSTCLRHRLVRRLQTSIDDRKCFAQLVFSNTERRVGEESIPTHEGVKTFLTEVFSERLHLRRSSVERRQRLQRLAISYQLNNTE